MEGELTAVNDITDFIIQYKLKNEKKHDADTRTSKRRAHSADEERRAGGHDEVHARPVRRLGEPRAAAPGCTT